MKQNFSGKQRRMLTKGSSSSGASRKSSPSAKELQVPMKIVKLLFGKESKIESLVSHIGGAKLLFRDRTKDDGLKASQITLKGKVTRSTLKNPNMHSNRFVYFSFGDS